MSLLEEIRPFEALAAARRTATANGTGIDLWTSAGRAREVTFVLTSAAGTGTTPTLNIVMQESPDNVTFTDIALANHVRRSDDAAAAVFATVTTVASFQERTVRPQQRYVRARAVIAGTTPSFDCAVVAIAGEAVEAGI